MTHLQTRIRARAFRHLARGDWYNFGRLYMLSGETIREHDNDR